MSRYLPPAEFFSYWKDGNTHCEVRNSHAGINPKPFHVQVAKDHYIPISILVFAESEEHAWYRVRKAAMESCDKHYNQERMESLRYLIEDIDMQTGEYTVTIKPFDVDSISCKVNWASNGGW